METINLFELKKLQTSFPKVQIVNSQSSCDFIRQFYGDDIEIFESFFILMLNVKLETIGYAKISQGGIVSTIVDVRILCKYAVESLCTSCIIAHNHPSGNLKPSTADEMLTNKIKNALELFDIRLQDHIILTKESYYSFDDNFKI